MGFYELGNGCDSCETVQSVLPQNLQMDPNSGMVASIAMPYGTQNNMMMKQYNTPTNSMVMVPTTVANTVASTNPQVMKQVMQTANNNVATVVVPTQTNATVVTKNVEGFSDGTNLLRGLNNKMWIVLGLVFFSALAANECCKYFLNKSLQLNDANPLYYVAYVGVAMLLTFAAYTYASKSD